MNRADRRIIGVIPARMGSSRFPGKPLALLTGIPMVGHVYFRSKMCPALDEVYIATCDQDIMEYAESIQAPAILTSSSHERATDRTAEAMLTVEKRTGKSTDIVVLIQGDEPMLHPDMIDEALAPILSDERIGVVNLAAPLDGEEEQDDPNEVKVVLDREGYALYFSREPIPSRKKANGPVGVLKQVCIMPFRRDWLLRFNELPSTPLEQAESVDMLRFLEHGYKVRMAKTGHQTYSVDTPEDLACVEALMREHPMPYGPAMGSSA